MELRDEELEEVKQKYLSLLQQEKEGEKKFEGRDTEGLMAITDNNETRSAEELTNAISVPKDDSKTKSVSNLEEQLFNSVDTIDKLKLQLEHLRKENIDTVAKLQMEKTELSNDIKTSREPEVEPQTDKDNDSPNLHRYWEEKTSKTKEVESTKNFNFKIYYPHLNRRSYLWNHESRQQESTQYSAKNVLVQQERVAR